MTRYLIVGNGVAGMTAALGIRRRDLDGPIQMVHAEDAPTYFRAGLSEWLHGRIDDSELSVRPEALFDRLRIERIKGRVTDLGLASHAATLADGRTLGWDRALIATGAQPRVFDWPGRELSGVVTYRTWADSRAIRDRVRATDQARVVVVGGGILGMEAAYDCHGLGAPCTLLVRGQAIGSPLFNPAAAEPIQRRMADAGVEVACGEAIERFEGEGGQLTAVWTTSGRRIACGLVILCIGVAPSASLAEQAQIECRGHVLIDTRMATSAPDVFAAGDVAALRSAAHAARPAPIRTWEPAYWSGYTAGLNMAGDDHHYDPRGAMNASLVYDLFYVLLGDFAAGGDNVERLVAPTSRGAYAYRELLLRDGRIIGGTFIEDRRQYLCYRRLIADSVDVNRFQDRLFDDNFDLNLALPRAGMAYFFF